MLTSDFLFLAFSIPGLLIALYFVAVSYRIIPPDSAFLPRFCRMDDRSCASILHTPHARLLRIAPNALFGVVWYLVVLLLTFLSLSPFAAGVLTAVAWLTVLMSAWLAWVLRVRMRTDCPLCYTSHLLNVAIALTLTLR